jgi:hypothetical protein
MAGLIIVLSVIGVTGLWIYFRYGHHHVRKHLDQDG